ncbi:Y-family DNA polymerase [Leeia sp.]|uniref:Y-family DNA polymerase n=1 Tax=Leeia sp. TaxID=2884678 RepID=UPI0035B44FD1
MLALVDANSFYVSCQQVFEPRLRGKPVVVLSNNDGCIVSRSAEAKALGVPMGAPWHQVRGEAKRLGVIAFSSHYPLYADMSHRLMSTLARFAPRQEIYSIDECFLDVSGMDDLPALGQDIRRTVLQWTGLPVGVGFGPSKTLAKLANLYAKREAQNQGVFTLNPAHEAHRRLIQHTPAEWVWGIGRRLAARLRLDGLQTVGDLLAADSAWLRRRYGVVVQQTVLELHGQPCQMLMHQQQDKQQIISTRSFGRSVFELAELEQAVSSYLARACHKLRQQHSLAGGLAVYLRTNPHLEHPQYSNSQYHCLHNASDDILLLTRHALQLVRQLYRPGYAYAKAGVMLLDLRPQHAHQPDLLTEPPQSPRREALNQVLDQINQQWGRSTIHLATNTRNPDWHMRQAYLSPGWTTLWADMPQAS